MYSSDTWNLFRQCLGIGTSADLWLRNATNYDNMAAMGRKRFTDMNCGIAQALDAFGDWWTLLVVRDAFFGIRRFSDFQQNLGIARNILADRLSRLVDQGIMVRIDAGQSGQRYEYELTDKGEALLPVLTALRDWSDAWVFGKGREPLIVTERKSGKRIQQIRVLSPDGRALQRKDLHSRPGPGADESIFRLFQTAAETRSRHGQTQTSRFTDQPNTDR